MTASDPVALLGEEVRARHALRGGDLSQVVRLELVSGRSVIAKIGPTARIEADMLQQIAASGALVPAVLAVGEKLLILEDLGPACGFEAVSWSDLGRVVALVHARKGDTFGWPEDHAFGAVGIDNTPTASWPRFWRERRLAPHLAHLPPDLSRSLDTLCSRLGDRLPDRPAASLLHGDLWVGNVMASRGRITGLIDPACYYGHREVDLAMLFLFGSPGRTFWEGYGALCPGAEERRPIYALWPALVHLRLFGTGYLPMIRKLLAEAS